MLYVDWPMNMLYDIHVIKFQLGGNSNGTVVADLNINVENCLSWIMKILNSIGAKGSD